MRMLATLALLSTPAVAQQPIDATLVGHSVPSVGTQSVQGPPTTYGTTASDDFNRPDGTNMGADWIETAGDAVILNNAGTAASSFGGWMRHATATDDYADASQAIDFFPATSGSTLVYVALIFAASADGTDCIFVKIQDNNSDGLYDRVYFYKGINGGSWGAPNYFYDLVTPTLSGRMAVSFINGGDEAVAEFDLNFDGVVDETYTAPGLLAAGISASDGVGIGFFNSPGYDNWALNGGQGGPTAYCSPAGANSISAGGAILTSTGGYATPTATFQLDDIPTQPGLLYTGTGQVNLAFGCGQRCVGGTTFRGPVLNPTSNSIATSFAMIPTAPYIQYWYRDPANFSSCGSAFNLSNALMP